MEHLSGGSLEELLRRSNPLKIDTVRFYTAEIVCGLQFLHGHNIVHRDIKPDNIMLHGNGHIQIIDMGLARNIVTSSKKICGMAGTCHYMAPEMLLRQDYDAAVDWWSLGIVISRMSSGYSPFYFGDNWEVAKLSIIKDEPRISTCLNDQLQHLLKDLLQKNPEKRLGVNSNIRGHPFFNTICWEDLGLRRVQPPFIPSEAVLEKQHLSWPEHQFLQPVAKFNFMSPSWTRSQVLHVAVVLASVTGQNTFMTVKIITKKWENAAILRRERQILLKSRQCPFLCHLYAAHQSEDRAYFIMEYLSGGSLEELLRRSNPLKIDTVRCVNDCSEETAPN
ncbi:protein kinase C delta type-like [Leptodactylus fuscus]